MMPHSTDNQNSKKKKSTSSLEKALIASEIRYRRLFESAKDGILILDAETGMIVDVNPFLINLLGYSKESFIEKTIWEIGFFKDIFDNKDKFLELQRHKYVRYEDLPLETAEGHKINVEFVSNVYLVNNHKVIQCDIRDITKRKEKEASLENTRKELAEIKTIADEASMFTENVIDTIREPLLVLDDELRVIKASHSFYNFFKVNPKNTIGRLIYELGNHQWDIPKLRELLEKILPEKTTFDNYEVEHNFSSIGTRIMLLNARKIKRESGKKKIILLTFEDVSERRREERLLGEKSRLNIEYLNILLDHAHAPIIIWDSLLLIKRFNHEFEKLSGYNKSEVQDKKIEMLFPKNEVASTLELIKNNIHEENPEVIEINILTKDNEIKTVLWNSANISDEEGKNTVATIAQDITSRKRSETILSESEKKTKALLDAIPDLIFRVDREGTFLDYKADKADLYYQSEETIIGKKYRDITPPEFADLMDLYIKKTLDSGEFQEFEYQMNTPKRGLRDYEARMVASGKDEVISVVRDITEHKQAEEILRESEIKTRTILEAISTGIMIIDPETHTIVDINSEAIRLIGETKEKIVGCICHQYICPAEEGKCPVTDLKQIIDNSERVLINKEGTKIPILKTVTQINLGGRKLLLENFTDITERKLTEEEIHKSEQRYRNLFENAGTAIWEADLSDLRNYISQIQESGIRDFRLYFDQHVDEVIKCASMVKLLDANKEILNLLKAKSKKQVLNNLSDFFIEESFDSVKEVLIKLAEGNLRMEGEMPLKILTGELKQVLFQLSISPGEEEKWAKGIISFIDITDKKKTRKR